MNMPRNQVRIKGPVNLLVCGRDFVGVSDALACLRLWLQIRQINDDLEQPLGTKLSERLAQIVSRASFVDGEACRVEDGSGIEPFVHSHEAHAGSGVSSHDCAFDWGCPAPTRKQ